MAENRLDDQDFMSFAKAGREGAYAGGAKVGRACWKSLTGALTADAALVKRRRTSMH